MTEKRVKEALKKYLKSIGAYYYMPVPMGYGAATVDFLVCYKGKFYGIETKREGVHSTTVRQACVLREIAEAGGGVVLENSAELENVKRIIQV